MLLDCCLALTGNIWQVFHGLNSDTQLCCSTTKCFPTIRLFFQVALLHPRNNHKQLLFLQNLWYFQLSCRANTIRIKWSLGVFLWSYVIEVYRCLLVRKVQPSNVFMTPKGWESLPFNIYKSCAHAHQNGGVGDRQRWRLSVFRSAAGHVWPRLPYTGWADFRHITAWLMHLT